MISTYVILFFSAISASFLTLYSGFGLGTLLLPVYALFFPLDIAIVATAIVHGANSTFKLIMLGRSADKVLVLLFGLPAIFAAFLGAWLMGYMASFQAIYTYNIGTHVAVITPIKLCIALLMFMFALFELLPVLRGIKFERKYLVVGGLLSGFFGGFSGHQGALRAAFLTKVGISAEAYVATNAVIGFLVDMIRIVTYGFVFYLTLTTSALNVNQVNMVVIGIVAAFLGVMLGKRYLYKLTMNMVQNITGVFLIGIALALAAGII